MESKLQLTNEIWELKNIKENLEKIILELKNELVNLNTLIENKEAALLNQLKEENLTQCDFEDLVAVVFKKENISSVNDSELLKYLKENNYNAFIKTKITESIDKNPLKKELKNNANLAAELSRFTENKTTEYVVVTTKQNYEKMLQHIDE